MPTPRMTDVMVDLETVGKRPGCALISIGAVEFSPLTGELGREFYQVVNIKSCKEFGLEEDPETVKWWLGQEKAARKTYDQARNKSHSKPLVIALERLTAWLEPIGKRSVSMWGCGAGFDQPILVAAYEAAGMIVPWEFWNDRCYRTLKGLYGGEIKMDRQGTHHNALDDARDQARHAVEIFKHMRALHQSWASVNPTAVILGEK
jgi:hypothetical protein